MVSGIIAVISRVYLQFLQLLLCPGAELVVGVVEGTREGIQSLYIKPSLISIGIVFLSQLKIFDNLTNFIYSHILLVRL
jgi:hypothetical protein